MAIVSWPVAKTVGLRLDIIDYPNDRKIHALPTLRTGGLLIMLAYTAGLLLYESHFNSEIWPLIVSVISIFTLGILEDKYRFGAKSRLFFQAGIAFFFILGTGAVLKDLGLFGLPLFLQVPFTIFSIVGVINAFNIIDGMNGLSSGLGVIGACFLSMLALFHRDNEIFIAAALLVGPLLGFMIFNLRGKMFMGESGSYLIGFVLSALSVMLAVRNPGVSPFAPLLIVLVPIFDTLFAIYRRRLQKKDPFGADRRHLHHRLARRYKSNVRALMVILLLQSVIALLAILFHEQTYILVAVAILSTLFLRRMWFKSIRFGIVGL
jgi:UDP-GlcNAc:undecaprenyl-phosphate GlcNAc-1-phosphate transferase